jgi:hypothetical protein
MRANNPGIWRLLSRAVYDISAYLFGKDGLSTGWGRFRRLRFDVEKSQQQTSRRVGLSDFA